jgi:hypothetical protein
VNAVIGRLLTHERSLVGRNRRASFDDFIAACDKVLFCYDNIRKGAVHHSPDLLEAFQPSSYRHSEVVGEVLMEKMRDSVNVVFILENSRELPDDLLIQLFLHKHSFPEIELIFRN